MLGARPSNFCHSPIVENHDVVGHHTDAIGSALNFGHAANVTYAVANAVFATGGNEAPALFWQVCCHNKCLHDSSAFWLDKISHPVIKLEREGECHIM